MKQVTQKIIDRFFKYVDKQDYHWIWTGAKSGNQGRIKINGVVIRVMKLSYVYHFGTVPEWSTLFRKCGNPNCVNPEHLEMRTDSYDDLQIEKAKKPEPRDFELVDLLWVRKCDLPKNYYQKVTLSSNEATVT